MSLLIRRQSTHLPGSGFPPEDCEAYQSEGERPRQRVEQVEPGKGLREGSADGELHRSIGWEPHEKVLVGKRVAERVLERGIHEADHDDEEEAFQFATYKYAKQQAEGAICQGG